MWVRFGRWVELGVHFGRQNTSVDVLDRYLMHASVRFGKREWNHGPDRPIGPIDTSLGNLAAPCIDLYPDPEPLRWGVRKVVSTSSCSAVDTKHRPFSR